MEAICHVLEYFYLKVIAEWFVSSICCQLRGTWADSSFNAIKMILKPQHLSHQKLIIYICNLGFVTYSWAKWSRNSSTALFTIWTLSRKKVKTAAKILTVTFCHSQLLKMCCHWLYQHKLISWSHQSLQGLYEWLILNCRVMAHISFCFISSYKITELCGTL